MKLIEKIKEKIKKKDINKRKLYLFMLIALFIGSSIIELLGFNFRILTLPNEQKGKHEISLEELKLQDLVYNKKNNVFTITGGNPAFSIDGVVEYINYLNIETDKDSAPIHINMSGTKKEYDLNYRIKKVSVLKVDYPSKQLNFNITSDDGSKVFKFNQIVVDNTITFNWLRFFLFFSIGSAIVFLVLFRGFVLQNLHIAFLVLSVTIGVNMSIMTPTYYAYDELQHFIRAYELANFDFGIFSEEKEISWIENIEDFFSFSGTKSVTHNTYPEFVDYFNNYAIDQYTHKAYYNSTAITYPFIPYTFSALGILIARLLGVSFICSFYMGRIFSLLGYVLVCYIAIKYAKVGKRIMFLIALLPVSLYSAAAYSADPSTLSFSLLTITIYTDMLFMDEKKLNYKKVVLFALCISMMTMCKITYAPFCLLILSVPCNKFKNKKEAVLSKLGVFIIVGIVALLTLLLGTSKGIDQWEIPDVDTTGQVLFIFNNMLLYIKIMISHVAEKFFIYFVGTTTSLAYCGTLSPIWTVGLIVYLFVMTVIDGEDENVYIQKKEKFFLALTIFASWALVLTALYITFTPVGKLSIDGVQGRYFAPLVLPLLLLFQTNKIKCDFSKEQLNSIAVLSSFFVLSVSVIKIFAEYCV
jgi:Predicted membrane protein